MRENDTVIEANCLGCNKFMLVVTDGSTDIVCIDCEDEWEERLEREQAHFDYRAWQDWGSNWQDSIFPNEY